NEGRLHFRGGNPVPGDVHDVVDASEHPDVAVGVVAGTVAGEVPTLLGEPAPVGVLIAFRIAPDAAQHGRPRLIQHQVAGDVLSLVGARLEFVAVVVDDLCGDA